MKNDRVCQHGGLIQLGLTGKTGIIMGGSMGIGKVTALALAQEWARVAICARGIKALQESARDIHATDNKVLPIRVDMTSPDDSAPSHNRRSGTGRHRYFG